jgi:DNA-binding beta-propeller fold protein YncE
MRATLHAVFILAAVTAGACSHAPATPTAHGQVPTWPRPPAAPRVRWERALPDPERPDRRSGFRKVVDAILGIEPGADEPVLVRPFGLATLPGRLLVADPDGPAVVLVDLGAASFSPLRCEDGGWGAPMAVAVGPGGVIYVADAGLGQVVKLGADGRCERWGRGILERPAALALMGDRLYVADPPRHTVEVFGLDGVRLAGIGGRGDGDGGFNFPTGLAAAPDGTLLVVDSLNFKVKRYRPDGSLQASFGEAGEDEGQFIRPKAVAVDAGGLVYVTDTQRGQVMVFTPAGAFLYAAGEVGDGPGQFSLPAGIAVDAGTLFVADGQHRRVETYRFIGDRS